MATKTATGPQDHDARRALLVVVGVLGLLLTGAGVAWACTPQADIQLSSSTGEAGSSVMVSGAQFKSGPLEINWEGARPLGLDEGPEFTETVSIPDAEPGTYTIVAEQGVHSARAQFKVVPAGEAPESGEPADGGNNGGGNSDASGGGGGSGDEAAQNTDGDNGGSSGDEAAQNTDGDNGDGTQSTDESPRRSSRESGSHDGWQPSVPEEPDSAAGADERRDDPASQRSTPTREPDERQHIAPTPQADTSEPAPAPQPDERRHVTAPQEAPAASELAPPSDATQEPALDTGDPQPADAREEPGSDPTPDEHAREPAAAEEDAPESTQGLGPERQPDADAPAAPSSRAGSSDLWSGFEGDDGASLIPGSGPQGSGQPDTGAPVALGIALFAGGLSVLALGGGLGVARRRASAHAAATRSD